MLLSKLELSGDGITFNPFMIKPKGYIRECDNFHDPNYYIYQLLQNLNGWNISNLMEHFARGKVDDRFWVKLRNLLELKFDAFNDRIVLLEKVLLSTPINPPIIIPDFPLILVCEDDKLMNKLSHEYRSIHPLKLGEHITALLTDTHKISCRVDR